MSSSESISIQEAELTRSTSSSWASTTIVTENAPFPFLNSCSTTIEPRSSLACDVSAFALPRSNCSVSTSQTGYLVPTAVKLAPQKDNKGKARAVLTPLLIGSNGGNSPASRARLILRSPCFSPSIITTQCHPCLPDSILRSHEPWWAIRPKNTFDVTYVNYKSVIQGFGDYVLQRIVFVPTKPDARVPGINILKILQADDVIVDGDKAVNIDSDVVELQYKGRQEKVQMRCRHTSITTHGLAYLMSSHIYHHLEVESDTRHDGHYIGNVAIAYLVSIFSVQPDIWLPEIAFVL
ncbi:hypothetical protein IW261DRAFT_1569322 [Armillaria novae-zelandiae]|uniref:Uncharacterized protein n=1 Tax=Armillaria novae-zelandiae TaxID=153914 RepID=A0AA39U484_9AGAR|nr:hypothetical protein IW261DRAFT_1569322 [Armillaria novae-zelandiae]